MSAESPTTGLVLVDTRVSPTTLDTANSAFTEAEPFPGRAQPDDLASRWRPQLSGAQSQDLTLKTLRGGSAGVRAGTARVAYRLGSDTGDNDYRGWNEPNVIANWTAPSDGWGSGADFAPYLAAVAALVESTGLIVVVWPQNSGTGAQTWSFDRQTGTWTTLYDWSTGPGLKGPIGLVYDSDADALILYSGHGGAGDPGTVAYRSTDGGASWDAYSIGPWDAVMADTGTAIRIASTPAGQDWLAFHDGDQFASSNRGVSWTLIDTDSDAIAHTPLWTGSGWCVVDIASSGPSVSTPEARLLSSARSPVTDAAAIAIDTALVDYLTACVDYDGRIYVFTRGDGATSLDDQGRAFGSFSGGAEWFSYAYGICQGATGTSPAWNVAIPAGGAIHLVGRGAGAVDTSGIVSILTVGGWSQLESGAGATNHYSTGRERMAFGAYYGAAADPSGGLTYIPWDLPDVMGWSTPTTGGTSTLDGPKPGLRITTVGAVAQEYESDSIGGPVEYASGLIVMSADSTGLASAGGGHVLAVLGDTTTYEYVAQIYLGSDGIRLEDHTTLISLTPLADTTIPTWIAWQIRKGGLTVWYKQSVSPVWTRIANDATLTNLTPGSPDYVVWGLLGRAAHTDHITVQLVGHTFGGDFRFGRDTIAETAQTPADRVLGLLFGKLIPPPAVAYPLPEASTTDPSFISATGTTYASEVVELPVDHRYDLDHIYPALCPRPSVGWRSTDDTAVELRWDQGVDGETWWGGGIALAVLRAWPRLWVLQQDNGGAGWTTLGTLDLAIGDSLAWTRAGRTVTPNAGTDTIDRYIHENELRGSMVDLDGVACEVDRNSPGYWTDDTGVQRVRITLVDPGAAGASGTAGVICAGSAVLVCYPAQSNPARRKLRVTVAGSQVTPDGKYRAGVVAIGRVLGLSEPGWDWSMLTSFSREVRRATDGTPSIRRTGPARVTATLGWTDGLVLTELHSLALEPDRIGITGGGSLGTAEDVASVLPRVIEGALESGQVPTILIRRLPLVDGVTLTDPDGWLYGVLISESIGVSGIVGTEGEAEAVRLDSASFEELSG